MIIDTNILLRFLLGEADKTLRQLFENEPIILTDMVISETVYVLHGKTYNYTRSGIKAAIFALLARDNVRHMSHTDSEYLQLYADTTLDLADCYLVRLAIGKKRPLKTFDKNIQQVYERELKRLVA